MYVVHIGIPIVARAVEVGHKATSGLWSIVTNKAIAIQYCLCLSRQYLPWRGVLTDAHVCVNEVLLHIWKCRKLKWKC
jgi:hypothetical protein